MSEDTNSNTDGQQEADRDAGAGGSQLCKVEGCERLMVLEDTYYRRYNVCKMHLRALELLVDGRIQRFCQQCGKFQDIADFDDVKRSCRAQLARHSLRRRIKLTEKRLQRELQQRRQQQQQLFQREPQRHQEQPAGDDGLGDNPGFGAPVEPRRASQSASRGRGGSSAGLFTSDLFRVLDGVGIGDGDGAAADQPQLHGGRDVGRGEALAGWRDGTGSGILGGIPAEARLRPVARSVASDGGRRSGSGGQFCLDLEQPPVEPLNMDARGRGVFASDELGPLSGAVLVSIARPGSSSVAAAAGAAPTAVLVADRRALASGDGGNMALGRRAAPPSAPLQLHQQQQQRRQQHPTPDDRAESLNGANGSRRQHPGQAAAPGPGSPPRPMPDSAVLATPFTFPQAALQLKYATMTPSLQQQQQQYMRQLGAEARRSPQRPPPSPQPHQSAFQEEQQPDRRFRGPPAQCPQEQPLLPQHLELDGGSGEEAGAGNAGGGSVAQRLAQYSAFRDAQLLAAQPIVQDVRLEHELVSLLGDLVAEQERLDGMYGTGGSQAAGASARITAAATGGGGGGVAWTVGSGVSDRGPGSGPSSGSDQQSGPLLLNYPAMASQSGPLQPPLRKPPQQLKLPLLTSSVAALPTSPGDGGGSGNGSGHKGADQSGRDNDADPAPHTPLVRDDLHMMSLNTGEMDLLQQWQQQPPQQEQGPQQQLLQQQPQQLQVDMEAEPIGLGHRRSGEPCAPQQVLVVESDVTAATAAVATGMDWFLGDGGSGDGRVTVPAPRLLDGPRAPGTLPVGGFRLLAMPPPLPGSDPAGTLTGSDSAMFSSGGDAGAAATDATWKRGGTEGGTVLVGPAMMALAGQLTQQAALEASQLCTTLPVAVYDVAADMSQLPPHIPGSVQQQQQQPQQLPEVSPRYLMDECDPGTRAQQLPVSPGACAYSRSSVDGGGGGEGPCGGLWSSGGRRSALQDAMYPLHPLQAQMQVPSQSGHQSGQPPYEQQQPTQDTYLQQQYLRQQQQQVAMTTAPAFQPPGSFSLPGPTVRLRPPPAQPPSQQLIPVTRSEPLQPQRSRQQQTHHHHHQQQWASHAAHGADVAPHSYVSAPGPYNSSQLLQRLSLKLHGCSPSDLMPDSRATIQSWLTSMNLQMLQLTTRSGCALLIADVLVPVGGAALAAGAGACATSGERLRDGGAAHEADEAGLYSSSSLLARMVDRPGPGPGPGPGTGQGQGQGSGVGPHPVGGRASWAPRAAEAAPEAGSAALRPPLFLPATPGPAQLGQPDLDATQSSSFSAVMVSWGCQKGFGVLAPINSNSGDGTGGDGDGGCRSGSGDGAAPACETNRTPTSACKESRCSGGNTDKDNSANGEGTSNVTINVGGRDSRVEASPPEAEAQQQKRQLVVTALGTAEGAADCAPAPATALVAAAPVSGSLGDLLRQLLGPLMAPPEPGAAETPEGQRLLLQLDDQMLCLTWPPSQAGGRRAVAGKGRDQDADEDEVSAREPGAAAADGGRGNNAATGPLPAGCQAAPPPELLSLRPAAIAAGCATRLHITLRLPPSQLADALFAAASYQPANGAEDGAPEEQRGGEEATMLHLRYGGDCVRCLELKPGDLSLAACAEPSGASPVVAYEAAKSGVEQRRQQLALQQTVLTQLEGDVDGDSKHAAGMQMTLPAATGAIVSAPDRAAGVVVELMMDVPSLAAPGLAFVESCRGDMLGPWLPLPVVPSAAVAAEVNALPDMCDRSQLQPFLCDLGRLLMLSAAGACLEEAGHTEDWDAFEEYCRLREAMPDAAVAAGRLLRKCIEWRLSECTALATSLFLATLNDPL